MITGSMGRTAWAAGAGLLFVAASAAWAGQYSHGYWEAPWWHDPNAWVPKAVPGEADTANIHYGITLQDYPGWVVSIGTLNIDTYISWGPPPDIDIEGRAFNILQGGQWQWGGFHDYYTQSGTINNYGTLQLVDDIADHYNNGPDIVDAVNHSVQWGLTFNNYGTMQQDSRGSFHRGAGACRYFNYGLHDITVDGGISSQGHGGEGTVNYGVLRKSGGTGVTTIGGDFTNDGLVESLSGRIYVDNSLDYEGWWTHELLGGTWKVADGADIVIASRGELEVNSGQVILDGASAAFYTTQTYTYTPIEDSLLINAGTLELHGDRTFARPVTNTGLWTIGDGTALTVDLANDGRLTGGNSPGQAVIDGDFVQGGGGRLEIEIGGLTPGDGYDVLTVTGTATLGGTLEVLLFGGFDPGAIPDGFSFAILQAEEIVGGFDAVAVDSDLMGWFEMAWNPSPTGPDTLGIVYHVPEPATLLLLMVGGAALAGRRR